MRRQYYLQRPLNLISRVLSGVEEEPPTSPEKPGKEVAQSSTCFFRSILVWDWKFDSALVSRDDLYCPFTKVSLVIYMMLTLLIFCINLAPYSRIWVKLVCQSLAKHPLQRECSKWFLSVTPVLANQVLFTGFVTTHGNLHSPQP